MYCVALPIPRPEPITLGLKFRILVSRGTSLPPAHACMRLCHQVMSRTVQIGNAACKSVSPLLHWTPMPNSVPYRGADIVITRMHRPTTYNLTIMLPTTVLICIQESLIRQHIHCAPTQGECLNAFRNVYRFPHGEASVPPSNSNPCLQPDRSP